MLILPPDKRREHLPWAIFTALAALGVLGWFVYDRVTLGRFPSGSSPSRFWLGWAGGALITFEMLLWPRKKLRARRLGRALWWMKAHIWMGLLCLPVLVIHGGIYPWGGALSTVLMVLLLIVIFSGIWGLWMQNMIPRRMLNDVPAETIRSQIPYILEQYHDEARELVRAVCGEEEPENADAKREAQAVLVIGATREVGRVQGKVLQTRSRIGPVPGSEPLRGAFESQVGPFLAAKASTAARSPLASRTRAAMIFAELKAKLDPAAHAAVDTLAELCEHRRQFDVQARLHGWLHTWIWVHWPLSAALFLLMIFHAILALQYR